VDLVHVAGAMLGKLRVSNISSVFSVEEMEHLDWNTRLRIIMGVAYCLQYMHHDLNPPIVHSKLCSRAIFLTDDYAAKVHPFFCYGLASTCLLFIFHFLKI
jgi:hypothetical protein